MKAKIKKTDEQTNIDKYRVIAKGIIPEGLKSIVQF